MKKIDEYKNILELFVEKVINFENKPFLWERINSEWKPITWKESYDYILNFASALKERGLQGKEGVSILSSNRKEWPLCDLAIILAGGITVGLYPTSSNVQCLFMINHSDSTFVIVDTKEQLQKILSIRKDLYKVKDIICIDRDVESNINEKIWNIKDFLILGKESLNKYKNFFEENITTLNLEDIIMYVYTSGTTGDPKAAMLSNSYVLYNSDSIQQIFNFTPSDKILSFLPYCHVGERIFGLGNSLISGRETFMVPNFNDLFQYIHEVNPTVFGGVPRIYEKMHNTVVSYVKSLPLDNQNEIYKKREFILKYYESNQKDDKLYKNFLEAKEFLRPLREMILGKDIKICTSGAAPLSKHIAKDFLSIGVVIYEAYGLTENICVSFNRPEKHKIGTVGIPMPYCNVKLSNESEIMVSGKTVFSGYYKNQDATNEIFDQEKKWIYTGDIGEFDEEGFLKIVDRKKEILITSTGKNIAPSHIENLLKTNPLISQAMIVGDGKSYISALITLNPTVAVKKFMNHINEVSKDLLERILRGETISINIFEILSRNEQIYKEIENFINEINKQLNRTEQIKKFMILPFDFSIERNEITPTLKLKRKVILNKYSNLIEQLYNE